MPSYESGSYSLGYVDPTDIGNKNLKQMMDWFYQTNYTSNAALWLQGAIDKRFKVGDQAIYSYMAGTSYNNNYARFFINLIRRHIEMMAGFQRKNRKSTVCLPVQENGDQLADDYNKCLRWCEDRDGYQEYLSQSFEGALDTGMNMLYMYPDYTYDPISGDLFTDNVSYNNFLIDQYFRKQDLSDCGGIWRRRWTTKMEAKLLLPSFAKEIDKMQPSKMKDGRFPVQAELQNAAINNLFTFDEFHYRSTRTAQMIIDPKSGEAIEWEDENDDPEMLERVLAQQPWLQVKKQEIPTVKLVIALGDKIVYHGPNLLNIDQYPCVPTICYYEPDIPQYSLRVMGKVRNMRDAQFLYNMRKVIELQILQSSINAGWIYPVDAVVDPKAFRQNSGGEGFLIALKAGKTAADIQRIEPVNIPGSLIELSKTLAEDITKISGVNEELLGAATDDKAAVLSMLRQGAGLTTLQSIYDRLDYTQRLYGKIRQQAMRKNFSKGKVAAILGHEPDPRFFSSLSQKYAIAIEEGNYSTTQRQMELQQLIQMRQMEIPIPTKSILRASFITNKKQIEQDMAEEAQAQQQAQQAQAQQQAAIDQAKIQTEQAKQRDLQASSMERIAKIQDLQASAEHKRASADLEMVKAMIELEDMDLQNFRSSLELAEYIKLQNKQSSQGVPSGAQ